MTGPARRLSGRSCAPPPRACWSTAATTAISWPRRSTSSRKWSATRWPTISTSPPAAAALPADFDIDFSKLDRLSITACGTASYAGIVAKYWFERFARLPVDIDIASEFRYREQPLTPNGLSIVISQSGETADTLASLRYAKGEGQKVAAIVNVAESTIAREAD